MIFMPVNLNRIKFVNKAVYALKLWKNICIHT